MSGLPALLHDPTVRRASLQCVWLPTCSGLYGPLLWAWLRHRAINIRMVSGQEYVRFTTKNPIRARALYWHYRVEGFH